MFDDHEVKEMVVLLKLPEEEVRAAASPETNLCQETQAQAPFPPLRALCGEPKPAHVPLLESGSPSAHSMAFPLS